MIDVDTIKLFVRALTGDDATPMNWRAIHDTDRGRQGIPLVGTVDQAAQALDRYNTEGYGIFAVINTLDGQGRDAANVTVVRAHFIDVDGDPDWTKWAALKAWSLPPTFSVVTSAGKHHDYWLVDPYPMADDPIRFETVQRKLVTLWGSDPTIIDGPRVMRVPGTAHMKTPTAPTMVGFVPGSLNRYKVGALEWELASVAASAGVSAIERHDLGATTCPSLDMAVYALNKIDPGGLDRGEWLKVTAAYKTSAMVHVDDATARFLWDQWCAKYPDNDVAENDKLWKSIRDTKTGWSFLESASGVKLERMFGGANAYTGPREGLQSPVKAADGVAVVPSVTDAAAVVPGGGLAIGRFLLPSEQVGYFNGCVLIESMGRILTPSGRFMDSTKFNAKFGGPVFVLDASGEKTTDEPWKAATRGQVFNVARADHIRFLPNEPVNAIIYDELGRPGVNTYRPAIIKSEPGDCEPFFEHLRRLMPVERDRDILYSYLKHCVQRPGEKAFWAPLLQSEQGGGKGVFKYLMTHALGGPYVYAVNARELGEGGGKFNAWMRNRLMIIADEIKVDDRRDMMEVLKPMITEDRIEVQGKGADQDMEDNCANWIMFTNHKDAIPISSGDRRYAIFYLAFQTLNDLTRLGMDGNYFPKLYRWLRKEGGASFVTHWLKTTPIIPEFDPAGDAHRAPVTSSTAEALIESRTRLEQLIVEAIEMNRKGFKGGWVSSAAVQMIMREDGLRLSHPAVGKALKSLGFTLIGRASAAYFDEDMKQPNLYHLNPLAQIGDYSVVQGYRPS